MELSYQVLKSVIEKVGAKMVAAELNVSPTLVYKWCEEVAELPDGSKTSGAPNPLDRIIRIYEVTEDERIINWLCQSAGGFFVKNIHSDKSDINIDVFQNIQRFVKEFSDTLDAIVQSYNDDKKISESDARKIRKEWEDLKRMGEAFVVACEAGTFNDKK
ncbi:MAG: hypothetical protein GXP46_11435 [Deferribacteres bacterium]|nr:hypothetical protein [Deferribacteres bacterium]